MIETLIGRLRDKLLPRIVKCTIGMHDLFPRREGQWELSLLAQDTLKQAGIDRSKPCGYEFDAKKGTVTFTQLKDDP